MPRPHIVMIDCHDLGQHLGCYAQPSVVSPNLDALAAEGILFENSFCTAPQCSPSRASLYTGRHAHSNGMFGLAHGLFKWRLHHDELYLAKYLQQAGYTTAHIGTQHVSEYSQAAFQARGFDHRIDGDAWAREAGPNAQQFIRNYDHDKPLFLNVGFGEPHRTHKGQYNVDHPEDSKGIELPPYIPDVPQAHQEFAELQGMIRDLDTAVGLIINALKQKGLYENTWIIFTTDHGLAMPRAKCTLYEAGIRTALIMRWPDGNLIGGRRFTEMVSHVDVLPTLLEALDLPIPERLHGHSYWPLTQGNDFQPNAQVYGEKTYHTSYEPMRCIRTKTHKLIVNLEVDIGINVPSDVQHSPIYPLMIHEITRHRPYLELYDLVNDPLERDNLAGKPEVAEIEHDLKQRLLLWMESTNDPILNGPIPSPYYYDALDNLKNSRG